MATLTVEQIVEAIEAHQWERLEAAGIRGGLDADTWRGYCGFDYDKRQWVEYSRGVLTVGGRLIKPLPR
jgi:hypothetical protein